MNKIILASGSPRRKELLSQLGITYEIMASSEEEITTQVLPKDIVQELSRQKAADICRKLMEQGEKSFVIIGADTMVALMDRVMGKPKDKEEASDMIRLLQGNVHQVYTGVTLCMKANGTEPEYCTFFERTDVSVYPMSEEEINSYVEMGESMDKAGAYAIQDSFAAHIKSICGEYNNVVGLPIGRLYQEMKKRNLV